MRPQKGQYFFFLGFAPIPAKAVRKSRPLILERSRNAFLCPKSKKPISIHRGESGEGWMGGPLWSPVGRERGLVSHVILSKAKDLPASLTCHPERSEGSIVMGTEILRFAQDDNMVPCGRPWSAQLQILLKPRPNMPQSLLAQLGVTAA